MKVDRRSFLSVIIGGTAGIGAGTALSPLPWKLTDDLSIWSQNWPWTPVPEAGAENYAQSTCTLCPGGCGISVRKIDNRAVKIEGMTSHPVNDGAICLLGLSGLQMLYGPTRVKTPMKRVGKRGEGKWRKITWNEALSEIALRLSALRKEGKAHSVAALSASGRGTVPRLLERFLLAYGSPNFIQMPSLFDAYEQTLYHMQGGQNLIGFDLERSGFVLSFGCGLLDGWGSPVRVFRANSGWKQKKVKLVQVEPRLSNTAAKADQWVPVNPGTESVLAFGIAAVILEKELYNKDFAAAYIKGLDTFSDYLKKNYPLKSVAEITGVESGLIISLAEQFAKAEKPVAILGAGKGDRPLALKEIMAVHVLNALVGSLQRDGGIFMLPQYNYIEWNEPEFDSFASVGIQKVRLDGSGSDENPTSRNMVEQFISRVIEKDPYPLDTLFVHQCNPLHTLSDVASVKKALDEIPLVVSFSSFMDETANVSDLILPEHFYLERYEDIPVVAGLSDQVVCLSKPVVTPQFKTRHMGDIIIELARAIGGTVHQAFPWKNYEICLMETMGERWGTMVQKGFWVNSEPSLSEWTEIFKGESGKLDLSGRLVDPVLSSENIPAAGDNSKFSLILIAYDSIRLTNGYIGNPPFMIKTLPDTVLKGNFGLVEINPLTAREKNLREGSLAILSTESARVTVKVHLSNGIKPGVVALPRGLGHTAYDAYLKDKGVNINELIPPVKDPISGHNVAWGARANLTKV